MAVTMNSAAFMGRISKTIRIPLWIQQTSLTLKKMFDISAKLVGEQDELWNVDTICWEKHSWKYLSSIGDEAVINLQRAKVCVFSDSVLCLWKIHQHSNAKEVWKDRSEWITNSQSFRDYDGICGEPTEFEWNIFPGFNTLAPYGKVTDLLSRLGETPENFTGRILLCRCSTTFPVERKTVKDNEGECLANAEVVSIFAKRLWYWTMVIYWSRFRKMVFYGREQSTKNLGPYRGQDVVGILQRADVQFSVQQLHCPGGKLRSKGNGRLSIHFAADRETIETFA